MKGMVAPSFNKFNTASTCDVLRLSFDAIGLMNADIKIF
jgi:hypothetical protein